MRPDLRCSVRGGGAGDTARESLTTLQISRMTGMISGRRLVFLFM